MKIRHFMMTMAIAALLSACVKPNEPKETHFSILGDSYSAYEGTVDPETNDVYQYDSIGVTSAEQMWWHKVAVEKGWIVDRNNSFSGSLVCNFYNFNGGGYYGPNSFIRRMDDLGQPDVIFVFGATNDAFQGAPLGEYVYADWTEEQLCAFRPALAYLFDYLNRNHADADIYFLIDMHLCSGGIPAEIRDAYIESIHCIANHYDVQCIDLHEIHKALWHPDAQGQEDIARQVIEALSYEI